MKKLLTINKQGRVLEYGGGEEVLDPELSKTVIHAAENNINKGVSKDGRYYTAYSDGVYNPQLGRDTMTLGDGVAETSDAPKHWFSGKPIPAKEVDDWTYNKMQEGVKAVKEAYNERFGTKSNPTPGDTITPSALAAVASTRYKLYRLGKHTNPILDALKSGLHSKLESALSAASGLNRSNRIIEALGGSYYKRAFGGRLIPKAQIGTVLKFLSKLPKAKFYRHVTAKALPSYKKYGVITQRDAGSHYSVPMFSKNSPSQYRLQTQADGDVWIIPKDNAPLEWETVKGLVVTPKYQGEYNKAPVSWFDFYQYHAGKGYEKLHDLNISPTSHVDYLKSLNRDQQIEYLVKNGLNDQWLWTLENNPDHLESALRRAVIP